MLIDEMENEAAAPRAVVIIASIGGLRKDDDKTLNGANVVELFVV